MVPLDRAAILTAAVALLLGCGGDEARDDVAAATTAAAETAPTTTQADAGVCVPLRVISEFDKSLADRIRDESAEWAETQTFVAEHVPEVIAVHDDVATVAPELAADLELQQEFLRDLGASVQKATSSVGFQVLIVQVASVDMVREAGPRISQYSREHCGFSTIGN